MQYELMDCDEHREVEVLGVMSNTQNRIKREKTKLRKRGDYNKDKLPDYYVDKIGEIAKDYKSKINAENERYVANIKDVYKRYGVECPEHIHVHVISAPLIERDLCM
jgi:hypothetical protein